jgi:hypothetical protein
VSAALLLWARLAAAHDPEACPPLASLYDRARQGALSESSLRCAAGSDAMAVAARLQSALAGGEAPGAAWRADFAAWLAAGPETDLALDLGERLAAVDAALGRGALEAASAGLAREGWSALRAAREARWRALAEQLAVSAQAPPPAPGEISVCADLGRVEAQLALGAVYAADRDCVVRLVERLEGEARVQAGWLAWALARRHPDAEARAAVQARLGVLLPGEDWSTASGGW